MKLDLLYEVQAPKPWPDKPYPYNQREAEAAAYFEAIEQIKLADKLGFGTVWVVEHHFRIERSHMPANEVFLAALSQVTEQIRLGFGVTLTPHKFRHPVRTAEVVAAVDVLSRGRVEWGTGRSIPHEQKAFGVDAATSRDSWREAIEAIVAMWEEEKFSWDSEFFKFPAFPSYEGDTRSITPKPYQDPHPPAWMAAVSPDSVELAGRLGLGMLALTIMQPVEALADRIKIYREAAANSTELLTRVKNTKAAPYTLVHCAEDMDKAEAYGLWPSVAWWYDHQAQFIIDWELPPNMPDEEIEKLFPRLRAIQSGKTDPKFFNDQDMIIVGDPEQCLAKLKKYEAAGCDSVICYMQFGQLKHEEVMASIEALGKHVIPKLGELKDELVYLSVDPGRQQPIVLIEPDDFASFMIVATTHSWAQLGRMLGDTCRVDPPHVWVDPAAVRVLGKASDPDWTAGLDAMFEYASGKGWTDGSGAVRAHCEWPLGQPGSP